MSAHSQVLYLDPKQFCHDLPRYITRLIRSPKVKVPFHVNNYEAFMDLFIGDVAASKMFRRSVYWWQHSQKFGGWIYKSAKDWRVDTGLKAGVVKRVLAKGFLEAVGVDKEQMQARGAPINHYRLSVVKFVRKLAEYCNITLEELFTITQMPPITTLFDREQPAPQTPQNTPPAPAPVVPEMPQNVPQSPAKPVSQNTQNPPAPADLPRSDSTIGGVFFAQSNGQFMPLPFDPIDPIDRADSTRSNTESYSSFFHTQSLGQQQQQQQHATQPTPPPAPPAPVQKTNDGVVDDFGTDSDSLSLDEFRAQLEPYYENEGNRRFLNLDDLPADHNFRPVQPSPPVPLSPPSTQAENGHNNRRNAHSVTLEQINELCNTVPGLDQTAAWYDLRRYGYSYCIEVAKTTALVKNLNNPPGFFRAQLQKGNPLVANADLYEENTRRLDEQQRRNKKSRYITGEYADYINH